MSGSRIVVSRRADRGLWNTIRGGWVLLCLSVALVTQAQIVSQVEMKGEEQSLRALQSGVALSLPRYQLPPFDVDSARVAMITESATTRLFHFAHPIAVDIDPIRMGEKSQLPDGTQRWRLEIASRRAKNLSLYFDRFELPEGALLYIYDSQNPRHRIGGFGAENNSDSQALQIQPISTDQVTIEVQAPRGTTPRLHLAEVTHGVREIPVNLPPFAQYNRATEEKIYYCTPEVPCFPALDKLGKGVVLIAIGGKAMGTGSLVNNTAQDGRPLILTAAHVPTVNFKQSARDNAKTMVVLFNYATLTCSGEIAPQVTQTLSGAVVLGESWSTDVMLLEMNHPIPKGYDATFLGWNASDNPHGPFTNIHHPQGFPKKVNTYEGEELQIISFPDKSLPFEELQHYEIPSWTMGTTAGGSSGSPLFDQQMLIIGGLTGGASHCYNKSSDQFFSLAKLWQRHDREAVQIISHLDPSGQRQTMCQPLGKKNPKHPTAKRHITNISLAPSTKLAEELLKLPMKELLGVEQGVTAVGERYKLRSGTTLQQVTLYLEVSEASGIKEQNELKLALYNLDQGLLLREWTQPISSALPLSDAKPRSGTVTPRFVQLQVQMPDGGMTLDSDATYLVSVETSTIPEGVKLLHQLHSHADRSTLYWLQKGTWQKTSERATFHASAWIDLSISHPLIEEEAERAEERQGIVMRHLPSQGLFFQARDLSVREGRIEIYTPLGEMLLKEHFQHSSYLLPRMGWEQYGMLLIRVAFGDQSETFKVILAQ